MLNQEIQGRVRTAGAIIVGAGVIGLSVARSLLLRGLRDVVVIDREGPGAEASWAAGGMLAPQAEAECDGDFFRLACASRDMYQAFAASLQDESGIDIELEATGTLYVAFTESDQHEIEHRFEWQTRAKLPVQKLSGDEARLFEPALAPGARAALLFPNDTQVENRKLVTALAASVRRLGGEIISSTNVEALILGGDRVEGVRTADFTMNAPVVVVACGAWTTALMVQDKRLPQVRIEPVRGQMLCFDSRSNLARHVIYSPRGYLVPRLDGRLLAGSTTEHVGFDKRTTARGVRSILENAMEISPAVEALTLTDFWSGLRPRASDDLPVIGRSSEIGGLFFSTGHYRNGILLTPITGELLAEEILTGHAPKMLNAFSPDRFHSVEAF
jgi:glycine oxidase